jgi:hypothetical protein
MYVYYEIVKVQAYAITTVIRLVVRLSLRGADRVMTLSKSIPLPVNLRILDRYVQFESETLYLAVTENGQFIHLATADKQKLRIKIVGNLI